MGRQVLLAVLLCACALATPVRTGAECEGGLCATDGACSGVAALAMSRAECSLIFPAPRSAAACVRHCLCLAARRSCGDGADALVEPDGCEEGCKASALAPGAFPPKDPSPRLQSPARRVAVFSTTIEPFYSFFAPITSLLWSSLQGYTPLLQLVLRSTEESSAAEEELARALSAASEAAGAIVEVMRAPPRWPQGEMATLAQVARLYAPLSSALPAGTHEERYFLTSDVDIWPIDVAYFNDALDPRARLHVLYSNAYEGARSLMYPICFLGANASVWLEIMRPDASATRGPADAARAEIERGRARYASQWDLADRARSPRWFYDQLLFGQRAAAWPGHPGECQLVPRAPGRDRVDRGWWRFAGPADLAGKRDCHVLRPGHAEANWAKLRVLLGAMLAPPQVAWLDAYRANFTSLVARLGL